MSGAPIDRVSRFYELLNEADAEGALACLHPDVEWVVPPETSPEPEVFRGHEGVRRDMERFASTWSSVGVELLSVHELGEGLVVVDVRWFGVAALSGVPVEMQLGGLWEVRDGLIVRFEHFPSVEAALVSREVTSSPRGPSR